jgi:Regulator of ribonuclease activity B
MLDLFFYFKTETGTEELAKELEAMGMEVSVRPPEPSFDSPEWAVLASGPVDRDWDRYEAMAARHGGKFDGWGSCGVKQTRHMVDVPMLLSNSRLATYQD